MGSTDKNKIKKIVTFYANWTNKTSWLGHIWVGFGEGKNEKRYGFYPSGLKTEYKRRYDVNYSFKVSLREFNFGLKVIRRYGSGEKYKLGIKDCRTFAADVANAIGLRVPPTYMMSPPEWLAKLVEAN